LIKRRRAVGAGKRKAASFAGSDLTGFTVFIAAVFEFDELLFERLVLALKNAPKCGKLSSPESVAFLNSVDLDVYCAGF
jgi:hypothetical protein